MKVIGNQNSFVTNSLQNTFFYVPQNKGLTWGWVNDDRIKKNWVNGPFNVFIFIIYLKYNTISISYLLNCCYKSTFKLVIFGTKSALVWYYSPCSCDIVWYKYDTKTHTGAFFAPISWILGHNCIYGVVALHHICHESTVWGRGQCVF